MTLPGCDDVLAFWREAGPDKWFRKDEAFDRAFRDRFLAAHEAAARGTLKGWEQTAEGALALLILLDQFPRNAFRGTPRVYATDALAREIAHEAIAAGQDMEVDEALRAFFYLPLMHSELLADQERCVTLTRERSPGNLRWALHHRDIIERFGRFPHRNALLGRESSEEERRFLEEEGGFGG